MRSQLLVLAASPYVRILLGCAVSGLAIFFAIHNISLDDVGHVLLQASPGFIALALLSVAINTVSKAIRWHILIGPRGHAIGMGKLLIALLIGQMLNTLIPARVGDISRAYVIGGMGPGRAFVFGTVVIEKFLDMIAYVVLFLLLIVLFPLPAWINQSVYALTGVAALVMIFVLLLMLYRNWCFQLIERSLIWLPSRLRQPLLKHLHAGIASLDVLQHRSDLIRLTLWTVLIWVTALLTNHLTLLALGIDLPPVASLLVLIVLQAGITLPSTPGKIGVFEYGCVLALAVFGIDQALGLGYGLLLHTIVLVPTTLIGLLFFWVWGLTGEQLDDQQRVYVQPCPDDDPQMVL